MMKTILKIDQVIYTGFRLLAIFLLCLLFVLMALNVVARFMPFFSMGWFDEIVELSFAWMVFTTAAMLWRQKQHPQIDFLEVYLENSRYRFALLSLIETINIVFLSVFTWYGYTLVEKAIAWSPIFQISRKIFYIAMPVSGAYMTVVSVFFLADYLQKLVTFNSTQDTNPTAL